MPAPSSEERITLTMPAPSRLMRKKYFFSSFCSSAGFSPSVVSPVVTSSVLAAASVPASSVFSFAGSALAAGFSVSAVGAVSTTVSVDDASEPPSSGASSSCDFTTTSSGASSCGEATSVVVRDVPAFSSCSAANTPGMEPDVNAMLMARSVAILFLRNSFFLIDYLLLRLIMCQHVSVCRALRVLSFPASLRTCCSGSASVLIRKLTVSAVS